MLDTEKKEKDLLNADDAEDGYIEDEDDDFQPEGEKSGDGSGDEDDDEDDRDRDVGRGKVDYSRIESESGGLVKTRRARQEEEEYARTHKYETLAVETIPAKVDSIWEELQRASRNRLSSRAGEVGSVLGSEASAATPKPAVSLPSADPQSQSQSQSQSQWQEDKILIERSYKFAGETVHEKKWVARSSAEGQEHLNSLKFKQAAPAPNKRVAGPSSNANADGETRLRLRRPLKRPPLLEQIISGGLRPKLTTLEKSQLDWASYVDRAGLNDELVLHNKDGFLARQEFLQRVGSAEDERYRELRRQQLAQQQQQEDGAS
ncbi:hypothetical protein SUVZ_04G4390 [Saccharomyces uvarum]|uniref:SWR1-complex protein 5 n=1 Tax=Saccharomyces uvarum TaxID=230603 RepID=A0ABN8WRA5_SACUV|nr:hypothetical protein SUVZ_04G4390 [Saccharomyces uvarum]